MRRLALLPLAALLLAACQEATTAPPVDLRPNAAAVAYTINERFPLELLTFVPCAAGGAGELVQLGETLHSVFHLTVNDRSAHLATHFQPQGVSGVGLTTGARYQATGVTRDNLNLTVGETYTYVNNFRIIGQGPGNNYMVHSIFHITVPPV